MQIQFDYTVYAKILRDNMKNYNLTEPKFIPILNEETINILYDGKVYCPTLQSSKDLDEKKSVSKAVKQLGKKHKFVVFSDKRILGTDQHILTEVDLQPRSKPYIWLVVDKKDDKLFWFKEYASASAVQDLIASLLIVHVDSISNEKDVSDIGKYIYKELFTDILGFNLWSGADSFEVLMQVNSAEWDSPIYSYNIRKLFGKVI